MPIQANLAIEKALHHLPIPATKAEVSRLNSIWNRQPPRSGRLTALHTKRGLVLKIAKPVVLLAAPDDYWKLLGRFVKRTGEPWWDICAVITDSDVSISGATFTSSIDEARSRPAFRIARVPCSISRRGLA